VITFETVSRLAEVLTVSPAIVGNRVARWACAVNDNTDAIITKRNIIFFIT
jgi:hypothetical protein